MIKIYAKRNMNELAELVYGNESYTCNSHTIDYFVSAIRGAIPYTRSGNTKKQFKRKKRIYLGKCTKERLEEAYVCFTEKGRKILDNHLEFVDG